MPKSDGAATAGGADSGSALADAAGTDAGPGVYSTVPEDAGAELTGEASADSWEDFSYGVYPASLGNDGDLTTRWCAADADAGHWWQVDLGASHTLSWIWIMWEDPPQAVGEPYLYTVDVSDNDSAFDVAIDESSNTTTAQVHALPFPSGTSGEYVRIVVTGLPAPQSGKASWASIYEVRIYGE
jgi:hypothetical protein